MSAGVMTKPVARRVRRSVEFVRRVAGYRLAGPIAASVFAAVVYIVYAGIQWRTLAAPSWDLGIFTQVVKHYALFQPPTVPLKGIGFNFFGDHFSPILAVFAPVYWVFPHAFALLVCQALLFAVSAFPVTRAAGRIVGRGSAALLGLVYVLSWGIEAAAATQFHEIAFAVPLLAFALDAMLAGRWTATVLWSLPLLLVKEDMGLTVAAVGLVLAWRAKRPVYALLSALGLAVWALVTFVVIPAANPDGEWPYSSKLDPHALVSHPWGALAQLVTPEVKFGTLFAVLIVTGLLCLRSPVTWIIVPTLAWRFLSGNELYWGQWWHYNALLMVIVFMALVDAIPLLRVSRFRWVSKLGQSAVLIAVVVFVAQGSRQPLMEITQPSSYQQSDRWDSMQRALSFIPNGATVGTDQCMLNYLVDRTTDFYVWRNDHPAPNYVAVDLKGMNHAPDNVADWTEHRYPGTDYRQVFRGGHYAVAQRVE